MYIITDVDDNIIKVVYSEQEAKEYVEEHPDTYYSYIIW